MPDFIGWKFEKNQQWAKPQLTSIFGTKSNTDLKKKLTRYGVEYDFKGRGEQAVYTFLEIADPFKLFAIASLGFDGNTDFEKVRNFYYIFFNDTEFSALPDEVKENRMAMVDRHISRQSIHRYTQKLTDRNLISMSSEYIYYFANKDTQRTTDKTEYLQAWHQYWAMIEQGSSCFEAIYQMKCKHGGVARKQQIPEVNGIYNEAIEYMLDLIQKSIENELDLQEAAE